MSKMAELAYEKDKYSQDDYIKWLEDILELLLENKENNK